MISVSSTGASGSLERTEFTAVRNAARNVVRVVDASQGMKYVPTRLSMGGRVSREEKNEVETRRYCCPISVDSRLMHV
jgi:hypothetical protein